MPILEYAERLELFPITARVDSQAHLVIGEYDTVELAAEFGTPLYIFDEATLRSQCFTFVTQFTRQYMNTLIIYASKAYLNRALARIFAEEELGLDVVSGGEIFIAKSADFPMQRVYFHGNNKSSEELMLALDSGVGQIVIDNFLELTMLNQMAAEREIVQDVLLRLSPGVDPHTHSHISTGIIDTKFGFTIATGQAEEAVTRVLSASNLRPIGLHVHIGSLIFDLQPYREAMEIALRFAADMKTRYGFDLKEFSPGGGFAIQYVEGSPPPSIAEYAEAITSTLTEKCRELGLGLPRLVIEPGRSIVGRAGVALYRVGAIKQIPEVRKYVSVDGGMADNIRPALYGARYEAVAANKMSAAESECVTIAGKYCESGDILIKDIDLPRLEPGDIIALPAVGAYCLAMASNYNASLKPAVVLIREGQARLIQRRETYQDLIQRDV